MLLMKKYLAFAHRQLAAHPGRRVLKATLAGNTVWIKTATPYKANRWHKLQKVIALILGQPILRTTVNPGGGKGLRIEAQRLQLFATRGFPVPQVLGYDDSLIILSDLGQELRKFLDTASEATRKKCLTQAATLLAEIHRQGLVHGRPFLRDMTWDGKQVGLLDLEENPTTVMPLVDAQARDIWLFLNAVSRYTATAKWTRTYTPTVMEDALKVYLKHHNNPKILHALKRFMTFLQPFKLILLVLWWYIGKGLKQAVFATDFLQQHLKNKG